MQQAFQAGLDPVTTKLVCEYVVDCFLVCPHKTVPNILGWSYHEVETLRNKSINHIHEIKAKLEQIDSSFNKPMKFSLILGSQIEPELITSLNESEDTYLTRNLINNVLYCVPYTGRSIAVFIDNVGDITHWRGMYENYYGGPNSDLPKPRWFGKGPQWYTYKKYQDKYKDECVNLDIVNIEDPIFDLYRPCKGQIEFDFVEKAV